MLASSNLQCCLRPAVSCVETVQNSGNKCPLSLPLSLTDSVQVGRTLPSTGPWSGIHILTSDNSQHYVSFNLRWKQPELSEPLQRTLSMTPPCRDRGSCHHVLPTVSKHSRRENFYQNFYQRNDPVILHGLNTALLCSPCILLSPTSPQQQDNSSK